MKMAILRIGTLDINVVSEIQSGLRTVFPEADYVVLRGGMPIPQDAYNTRRQQYNSSTVLKKIHSYVPRFDVDRVLGVTEVDLYVPGFNFVFGEAECPGTVAVISLHRLKPEFYGKPINRELFVERSVKEAVHEVGHMLGLGHCTNSECIMFFSNSIIDTDQKKLSFCDRCYPLVEKRIKFSGLVRLGFTDFAHKSRQWKKRRLEGFSY